MCLVFEWSIEQLIIKMSQAAASTTNTTTDQAKMEKYRKVRSEREAVPDGIIRVNRNI